MVSDNKKAKTNTAPKAERCKGRYGCKGGHARKDRDGCKE